MPIITSWCFTSNTQPAYYVYGENVYYQDNQVYYGEKVIATAEEYADQARAIAAAVPAEANVDEIEWLPLGVFAITEKDGSTEDATLFLQLALSKEGIVAGTVQNTADNETFEVEGTVDQASQRVAWGPVGRPWPIMETGIFNLSENEADVLLHFEGGETQQWSLTRLDEEQQE